MNSNFLNGYKTITGILITIFSTLILPQIEVGDKTEFVKNIDTILTALGLILASVGAYHKDEKMKKLSTGNK